MSLKRRRIWLLPDTALLCYLYHFKGRQFGYGGEVIIIAQDIADFAARLPRLRSNMPILIICREGQEDGEHKYSFARRRARVNTLAAGTVKNLSHEECKYNRMSSSTSYGLKSASPVACAEPCSTEKPPTHPAIADVASYASLAKTTGR